MANYCYILAQESIIYKTAVPYSVLSVEPRVNLPSVSNIYKDREVSKYFTSLQLSPVFILGYNNIGETSKFGG